MSRNIISGNDQNRKRAGKITIILTGVLVAVLASEVKTRVVGVARASSRVSDGRAEREVNPAGASVQNILKASCQQATQALAQVSTDFTRTTPAGFLVGAKHLLHFYTFVRLSVVSKILAPLWRQGWLLAVIGILAGWALFFERYRRARQQDLRAALGETAALAEQLTLQQRELGMANRVLALDYAVTWAIAEATTPMQAALWVLQTICVTTGWDSGAIWDVEPRVPVGRCVGIWQKPMANAIEFDASNHTMLPHTGLPGRVLASRQPHWMTDLTGEPAFGRRESLPPLSPAGRRQLHSGFGFPILVGSEVIGILELYSYEARPPEPELMQILSFIGSHIGQLLQHKRAAEERQQAEEALQRSRQERLAELERVRRQISTDLHDDVGSNLTKIALLSEAVRQTMAATGTPDDSKPVTRTLREAADADERLATITVIANDLIESMSDIVWAINPQKDYLSDLAQRMRRFASDIFTARRIAFRFRAPHLEADLQVGAHIRREVFLIFKESVNNAVKHAACNEVVVELAIDGGWLTLDVADNGKGFSAGLLTADTGFLTSQHRGGNGLASMRRRARALGGQLEIVTGIGQGTRLSLRVVLAPAPALPVAAIHTGGESVLT